MKCLEPQHMLGLRVMSKKGLDAYKASEGLSQNDMDSFAKDGYEDIKVIADAVHQAYNESTKEQFFCYNK